MQEKISIRWNKIQYDPKSEYKTIWEILNERFQDNELQKTLADLYDPYLLEGMKEAVERIKKAKENNERVIIFWDYDVDGVTSTSILMHFFKKIGMQISYRLPHRMNDGYGMKSYFMDELAPLWVTLVITVDCGTRDIEVIKHAKSLGIDVIVTDHHAVPDEIPEEAVAIINPKRKDCNYPFKHLSGAGVAFKLMMALAREYLNDEEYQKYLVDSIDIAAIGTVADCMPLVGENRIIVTAWLKQLKNSRSSGIRKLVEDKIHEDLDADVFGFLIGPRLNAAGRLDTPYKAVNLILNNGEKIDEILAEIEEINDKRKELTRLFTDDAMGKIDEKNNIIFYHSAQIEHGIIGIVAGRLTEQFHKPSIVLKDEWEKLVASCRSPEYFSIIEILEKYKSHFLHFGGHKQAAGFSISKENFENFKMLITQELNQIDFSSFQKTILADKVIGVEEFGTRLYRQTLEFRPFGMGNPKPIFAFRDFEIDSVEWMGSTKEHITLKNKYGIKIVWFFWGEYYETLKKSKKMDIIFDISENTWMGKTSITAKIIDIAID